MKDSLATAGLLALAMTLHLVFPDPEADLAWAKARLGLVHRLNGPGVRGFGAGRRAVLFFEADGMQGKIRGAVVVDGEQIEEVALFGSREGIDRRALDNPSLASAFRGMAARPPVVVQAISGATVSSQVVIDAVNGCLTRWKRLAP